jgi:NAD(P)-dependent dehydrogenase (short-subunit alcohol dehydrogenase family)
MRSIANELGENKIRVNAVCPGAIETLMPSAFSNELRHSIIGKMDIKRFGTVSEVADTLVFLMSDYSSHMTGQAIRIDGGMG